MVTAEDLQTYMQENFPGLRISEDEIKELPHEALSMQFPITLPTPSYYDNYGIMGDFSIRVSDVFSELFLQHRVTKCTPLQVREVHRDRFRVNFEVSTKVYCASVSEWNG